MQCPKRGNQESNAWNGSQAIRGIARMEKRKGEEYDAIITSKGGGVIFDSSNTLHYLAIKGNNIFLVEEKIN